MKDKARLYQAQRHEQPKKVAVKLSELEERVGDILRSLELDIYYDYCRRKNTTSSIFHRF